MADPMWLRKPTPRLKLDSFKLDLYEFQHAGAIFLAQNKHCLLRDETGLGKTPQVLAAFNALQRKDPYCKCIVICPASIVSQWVSEVRKFTTLEFLRYDGSKPIRKRKLNEFINNPEVTGIVMNYEIMRRDIDDLIDLYGKFPYILVLDEAQKIKNPHSKTARAAKLLSMRSTGTKMLTATPIFNHVTDLFGLFRILNPEIFPRYDDFLNEYTQYVMIPVNRYTSVPMIRGTRNLPKLKSLVSPYVFGRKKQDVYDQLPDLTFMEYVVELPEHHRTFYNAIARDQMLILNDGKVKPIQKLAALTHLQRCADALEHFNQTLEPSHPKIDEIISIIEENFEDDKIIVYSKFTSSLDLVVKQLKDKKIPVFKIDGRMDQDARTDNQKQWETTAGKSVLLISAAGGAGLNLQAGSAIIFLNYPWSYGEILQIYGRIHRIGSKHKKLLIINVFAQDTIDVHIQNALQSKRTTFNSMFIEPSETIADDALGEQVINNISGESK